MRTKTLLLACATLALGLATSQAQVYSQNVVGYVNVVLPGNGGFALIANPLDDGNGNHLTNIISAPVPGGNAAVRSVCFYYTGGGGFTINKLAGGWGGDVQFPPGTAFYLRNGAPGGNAPTLTNTFVGTVAVLNGASVTNDIPAGFSLQGSPIPYAGNIANIGSPNGDANMNYGGAVHSIGTGVGLTKILTWDPVGQGLSSVSKIFGTGNWGGTATVGVGQGFWISNQGADTNVVETFTP